MQPKIGLVWRIALVLSLVTLIAFSFGLHRQSPSNRGTSGKTVLYYVDPMHPSYRSSKPGTAPDCGMALVPVFAETQPDATKTDAIYLDRASKQKAGIQVVTAEMSSGADTIRVVGRVLPEDASVYRVNAGVDGFIRETFNDSVGTIVKKNDKLATYYAPEFLAAASGFLAASERIPGAVTSEGVKSIQNYTDRLRNLGMSDPQIERIAKSKQLPESVDVVAPIDGVILSRTITAGLHFGRDTEFYQIAALKRVWVVAEVDERDATELRPGKSVRVRLQGQSRQLSGVIAQSLPQPDVSGGTIKYRVTVDNPGYVLRPQMLVDVSVPVSMPRALTVPIDALIETGLHSRVYVQRADGRVEARDVETGWRNSNIVEIRKGLNPGESVVSSGTFLVDSETRLRAPLPASVQ